MLNTGVALTVSRVSLVAYFRNKISFSLIATWSTRVLGFECGNTMFLKIGHNNFFELLFVIPSLFSGCYAMKKRYQQWYETIVKSA